MGEEGIRIEQFLDAMTGVLGENMTTRREQLGLSQAGLGRAAGVTQSMISALERKVYKRKPKFETIRKIALALQMPMGDLLGIQKIVPSRPIAEFLAENREEMGVFKRFALADKVMEDHKQANYEWQRATDLELAQLKKTVNFLQSSVIAIEAEHLKREFEGDDDAD